MLTGDIGCPVNFVSWNVKSLNHPVKRKKVLSHLNQFNVGIAFLQDNSFQRKHLQEQTPFKPYWAFGHLTNDEPNFITKGIMDAVTHNTVNLLYTGATRSSCLLPCTTTIAKTKFRFEKVSDTEGKDSERLNWIVFYLPEEMRVTSTTMKVTTFSQILSDLGGTLGLWLGLGVLQLFQSVVIFKQNEAVKAFKKLMLRNDKPSV